MKKIIPSKEILICDVCNREMRMNLPRLQLINKKPIVMKRYYIESWPTDYLTMKTIDICDDCVTDMLDYIKSKRIEI